MAADFSKVRNDPLLDYAGAQLKQGGVLLDADANELVAILDRRLRALAGDVLGRGTVGANTPDAFKLTVAGGMLQIGRGRLYVDGLLAENHGDARPAQREFDPLLAETRFTAPIPYDTQPYFPNPPKLPTAGRHLVYLDVWQREVTHLERPDLIDSAVGIETSSRLQTVWQVRVLADEAGDAMTCASPDSDLEPWATLIAPSSGRLTTGTYEVSAVDDPCELPPTGGYRGLENQLYRVEIHDPGTAGAGATFKWSRENASVGSRVASMVSASILELDSLGRDDVLRFNSGDWVEIVDDERELAQLSGEIRKITVEEATRRISFAAALPAGMLPASFPNSTHPRERNLRVRRWDQKNKILKTAGGGATAVHQDLDSAGSTGVIDVPGAGTTILLENGVTVKFSSVGTQGFRSGDYWVFAARTADASVELLDAAPPRGIHHHYARLGLWDLDVAGDPTDCRHPWPPTGGEDCGCTACVTPESHASGQLTVQAAVDRIRDTGGTVCLHAGQYALSEAVHVNGARSVRIRGQGPATVVAAPGGAFGIDGSSAIVIENLAVVSLGRRAALSVRTAAGVALHDLVVLVVSNQDFRGAAVALSGLVAGLSIRNNLFIADEGIRALDTTDGNDELQFLITASLQIDDNILLCERGAVVFEGAVVHAFSSRICGNEVVGGRDGAIRVLGGSLPGSPMRICSNGLNVRNTGISCAVNGAWIEENKIKAADPQERRRTPGAGVALVTGLDPSGSDQAQVLANQIEGFEEGGILIQAPARDLIVKLNIIESCGNGIVMQDSASAGSLSIENNHLRDIGPLLRDAAPSGSTVGIGILRTENVTVADNTLRQIGTEAPAGWQQLAGILAMSTRGSRIRSNEITEIGPIGDLQGTDIAGIAVRAPYERSEISGNHVERDAEPSAQDSASAWQAVVVSQPDAERPIGHFGKFVAVRLDEARTLVINNKSVYINAQALGADAAGAAVSAGSSVAVRGNVLVSRGIAPTVSVRSSADIQFADNRCELRGPLLRDAVVLESGAVLLNANLVRGGERSVVLKVDPKRLTAVGNATTRIIDVNGSALAAPWAPLNVNI